MSLFPGLFGGDESYPSLMKAALAIQLILPWHFFCRRKMLFINFAEAKQHFCLLNFKKLPYSTDNVIQSTRRLNFDQQTKNLTYKQFNQKYNKVLLS